MGPLFSGNGERGTRIVGSAMESRANFIAYLSNKHRFSWRYGNRTCLRAAAADISRHATCLTKVGFLLKYLVERLCNYKDSRRKVPRAVRYDARIKLIRNIRK